MDLRNSTDKIMEIGKLSLIKGRLSHVMAVAENMRIEDEFECSLFDISPMQALLMPFAFESSITYTLVAGDKPVALMGTVETEKAGTARVWFLATEELHKHNVSFLKGCKDVIELLQNKYHTLENFVPIENQSTIKWLKWCGFLFDESYYSHNNYKFLKFIRCNVNKSMSYNEMSQPIYH